MSSNFPLRQHSPLFEALISASAFLGQVRASITNGTHTHTTGSDPVRVFTRQASSSHWSRSLLGWLVCRSSFGQYQGSPVGSGTACRAVPGAYPPLLGQARLRYDDLVDFWPLLVDSSGRCAQPQASHAVIPLCCPLCKWCPCLFQDYMFWAHQADAWWRNGFQQDFHEVHHRCRGRVLRSRPDDARRAYVRRHTCRKGEFHRVPNVAICLGVSAAVLPARPSALRCLCWS